MNVVLVYIHLLYTVRFLTEVFILTVLPTYHFAAIN